MRRYILAIHILVVLSVFNFVPVLAAPVPVQEVRKAGADVAVRGEDVVIVSGKRADEGQDLSTQAPPRLGSTSVQSSTSSPDPSGSESPSTSDHVHQETTNSIQLPSSASGEMRRPPYASGGNELPWYPSDDNELHLLTPGYNGIQKVQPSKLPPASSVRTKTYPFVATSEIGPASESSSSGEITPTSPSTSEQEGSLDQTPTKQPKPQSKIFLSNLASKSKSFLSNLASKSKGFLSKLTRISKSLFSELVDNPRLQIH